MPQEQIIKLGSFSPCIEGDLEWSLPRSAHTYALQCRTPKLHAAQGEKKELERRTFISFFLNTNIATGGPRYYIRWESARARILSPPPRALDPINVIGMKNALTWHHTRSCLFTHQKKNRGGALIPRRQQCARDQTKRALMLLHGSRILRCAFFALCSRPFSHQGCSLTISPPQLFQK